MKVVQSVGFELITTEAILKKAKMKVKKDSSNLGVINISQGGISMHLSSDLLSPAMVAVLKSVLTAGLYPRMAQVSLALCHMRPFHAIKSGLILFMVVVV